MWSVEEESESIECGDRPRCIVASRYDFQIFVGSGDGTVTRIEPDGAPATSLQTGLGSVEALYELDESSLLVGDRLGRLACGGSSPFVPVDGLEAPRDDGSRQILWIGSLDDLHLIVGRRQEEARILRRHGREVSVCEAPHGFTRFLLRTIPVAGERWLFISQSGLLRWLSFSDHRRWSAKWIQNAWARMERPGFVADVAAVTPTDSPAHCREVYLATDVGVLQVSWNDSRCLQVRRVQLTGLRGLCTTLLHHNAEGEPYQYLWAADSAGYLHLFRSDTGPGDPPRWRPSCLHRAAYQVIKAVLTPRDRGFVVTLACRDDRVRRIVYRDPSAHFLGAPWRDSAGDEAETWQPEARFADEIEGIGEENPRDLANFLANPDEIRQAWSILEQWVKIRDSARFRRILSLWTHTFLGTIHRRVDPDRRETSYLGLIRWLRRLGDEMFRCLGDPLLHHLGENEPDKDQPVIDMLASIESSIHYVRKWGLFGRSFAHRRESLIHFCELTARSRARLVERLVYHGLVFHHRFDLEDEQPAEPTESQRTFCEDLRLLRVDPREILAVSWRRGGVEIYERRPKREEGLGFDLKLLMSLKDSSSRDARAYSRQLMLGVVDDRIYLLEACSCRRSADDQSLERLRLYSISGFSECIFQMELSVPEAVCCLLELESGRILAGLQGRSRQPALRLINVSRTKTGLNMTAREIQREIRVDDPPLVEIPVLSLEKTEDENSKDHVVFAGCRDGQIWEVRIPRAEIRGSGRLIAQMDRRVHLGSPISALASGEKQLIAGTTDGTVMAWTRTEGEPDASFVPLWASCEGSPIRRLHMLEKSVLDDEPQLVLAMTEDGHAVVLSNRSNLDGVASGFRGRGLVRGPGHRLDSIDLQATCFASVLLEPKKRTPADADESAAGPFVDDDYANTLGRVARLAVATRNGRLRLTTLFYPHHTACRRRKLEALARDWNRLVASRRAGIEPHAGQHHSEEAFLPLDPHLLRHADTVHATDPNLPRVMVMWIVRDPRWLDDRNWPGDATSWQPKAQWFSRLYRPLAHLRLALDGKKSDPWRFLGEALEKARRAADHKLFEDILVFSMKEAHRGLLEEAQRLEGDPAAGEYAFTEHQAFLEVLGRMSDAWIGHPEIDSRIRTVIARNFPNGRILWILFRKASQLTKRQKIRDGLAGRMKIIRDLLHHRDSQVALEMLRSSNEAILLVSVLLQKEEGSARELRVEPIEEYIKSVLNYASRTAHDSQGGLPDGVAHEVLRAFVLAMFVCPSATLLWSTRLLQCGIPNALSRADEQIRLVGRLLGASLAENAVRLHRINTAPLREERGYNFDECRFGQEHREVDFAGEINAAFVTQFMPFQEVVEDLHELTREFMRSPGRVTLGPLRSHLQRLGAPVPTERDLDDPDAKSADRFVHSRAFWSDALGDFERTLGEMPAHSCIESIDDRKPLVRPQIVLVSRSVADWCRDQLGRLERRKKTQQIFEPQHTLYERALRELETAARAFRDGSALQKNVVVGVLEHELLARLEEHLLELWEVAQALHPQAAWDHEEDVNGVRDREDMATATRFAHYLLTSARNAESIPRVLRTLRGLLQTVPDGVEEPRGDLVAFLDDFAEEHGWQPVAGSYKGHFHISRRERHFLRLTLREIAENDDLHGSGGKVKIELKGVGPKPPTISISCRADEEHRKRLRNFRPQLQSMQTMIQPLENVPSLGTGLYLANLAAARVGWLFCCKVSGKRLVFKLQFCDPVGTEP